MLKIFISYSRHSEAAAKDLSDDVEALGHTVWLDRELSGGQSWWDRILAMIRDTDVFVLVMDPDSLDSTACQREYAYAADLGKTILPILAADGVSTNLLPPTLSKIQFVDYRKRDRQAALNLARAFGGFPPARTLPEPLPAPPAAPLSYLGSLTERVGAAALSYEEQSVLVVDLRRSLRSPENREDARTLLEKLKKRRDLFANISEEIDEALGSGRNAGAPFHEFEAAPPPRPEFGGTPRKSETPVEAVASRRFVAALLGGLGGTALAAIVIASFGGISEQEHWFPISLLWGGVPWTAGAAITGKNRSVVAIALAGAVIGFVVAVGLAASTIKTGLALYGMFLGAGPGLVLGAIVGVIHKRRKSR